MKKFLLLIISLSLAFSPLAIAAEGVSYQAHVQNISDRQYEPAVIDLLDNAKESIVISMYIINPSDKGPVALLVNDLAEALDRGVTVAIYLNTKSTYEDTHADRRKALFNMLRGKGANIYEVDRSYRLHDKVIIVDSRYVVEGSTNWSVSALKSNYESNTLIDSPGLAEAKLRRIRELPLQKDRDRVPEHWRGDIEVSSVEVKVPLIEGEEYFTLMISNQSDNAMDVYLLLLREALNWEPVDSEGNALSFPVELVDLADKIGLDDKDDPAKRLAIRRYLKNLSEYYGLIDAELHYNRDAWVIIKDLPGDTITIDASFFEPAHLRSLSPEAKYLLLIKALLAERGETLDDYNIHNLAKKFHLSHTTVKNALKELGK